MRLTQGDTRASKLMSEYTCEFLRPVYIAFYSCLLKLSTLSCVIDARHSLEGVLDHKWLCTVGGAFVLASKPEAWCGSTQAVCVGCVPSVATDHRWPKEACWLVAWEQKQKMKSVSISFEKIIDNFSHHWTQVSSPSEEPNSMRVTSGHSSCFISDAYEGHLRVKQDGVVIGVVKCQPA